MSRRSCSRQEESTARKAALFFCAVAAAVGLAGGLFLTSCAHGAASSGTASAEAWNAPAGGPGADSSSGAQLHAPELDSGNSPADVNESLKAALARMRLINSYLRDENHRLQSEIIEMNEKLAAANETIYSLNRKLDAIFKPEPGED